MPSTTLRPHAPNMLHEGQVELTGNAKTVADNRRQLVAGGAIEVLLVALGAHEPVAAVQEFGAAALLLLAQHPDGQARLAAAPGGLDGLRRCDIPNAGVNRLRWHSGRLHVDSWADASHLEGLAPPLRP